VNKIRIIFSQGLQQLRRQIMPVATAALKTSGVSTTIIANVGMQPFGRLVGLNSISAGIC
jgi:hypothetical protein